MPRPESNLPGERIGGSFRDPSGYVFKKHGRIFRAIDGDCFEIFRQMREQGILKKLCDSGILINTWHVDEPGTLRELRAAHEGFEHFLEHDFISPITYPYEWTLSMLADAGLTTLDLQVELLRAGLSLKDATAYNVQFVNGRPVFIDFPSIERPNRLDLWYALGQFGQMFTVPLLLCRHYGWDLRSYFLASIGGRTIEQTAQSLGWAGCIRPRALLDITLPLLLGKRAERKNTGGTLGLGKGSDDKRAQLANIHRIRRKLEKLSTGYRPRGVWAEYTRTCTYKDTSEQCKKSFVKEALLLHRPKTALDLGCNTGAYSYVATEAGCSVVAVDGDHDAVDLLYRRLRRESADITPMVIDVGNPSPAIGFRNLERDRFGDRVKVDCVLALALIHHLTVTGNLSLAQIRDLFYDLARRHVILEFVPPSDVMFQRLLRFRRESFEELTLETCRSVFCERFRLLKEHALPGSPRTLLLFEKPQS